jgi:hypothetical protein
MKAVFHYAVNAVTRNSLLCFSRKQTESFPLFLSGKSRGEVKWDEWEEAKGFFNYTHVPPDKILMTNNRTQQ